MNNRRRIKIGLDFHGVITDNPDFFCAFTAEAVRRLLDDWHISYTTIFAILDFYEHLGKVKYFSNGEFKVKDALWNTAKARYCQENRIDFHIDDSQTYAKWFSTPFCCYNQAGKECSTQTQIKAADALDEIERLVRHQSELPQA